MAQAVDHRALGQGLVEYALILVLVAVVVIGAVTAVGKRTSQVFDQAQCTLDGRAMHVDNGNGNSNRCD
jgi:pilus assembly protein Flp/PilA